MNKKRPARSPLSSPIPLIKPKMKKRPAPKSPLASPLKKRQMKKRSAPKSPLDSPIPVRKQQMKKRSTVKSPLASPFSLIKQEMKKRSTGKSNRLNESHLHSNVNPHRTSEIHSKSPLLHQNPKSPPLQKVPLTISDVKELASSSMESMRRYLDLTHSDILKGVQISGSKFSKKIKLRTQTCQQLMDETQREYKKLHDRMEENLELAMASYAEFITEAHAAASHVRKVSIPELAQSAEKAIEHLCSHYRLSSV